MTPKGESNRRSYHRLFELLEQRGTPQDRVHADGYTHQQPPERLPPHDGACFTRRDEAYFARTIGVNNLRAHFNQMEKTLRSRVGRDVADAAEHITEAQEILFTDEFFRQLVVQRSRAYARESQIREYGNATAFPERNDPQVAAYSIRKTYGRMLDLIEKAFAKQSPLFTLPMYYPLHWYRVDPSRKSGGALHRLHCFCLEFDGACEVQRRVPTDWIIEPVDVSGYGSFSLAS